MTFNNTKKAQDDVLVYFTGGIAKRLTRNIQSTPTPNRISDSRVGAWIYDKHERFKLLILRVYEIGDFL